MNRLLGFPAGRAGGIAAAIVLVGVVALTWSSAPGAGSPREPLFEPALGLPPWAGEVIRAAPLPAPSGRRPLPAGAGIEALVAAVAPESIDATVITLSSAVTRRADTKECHAAAAWLAERFLAAGVDSVFVHSWDFASAPNVVAICRGRVRPHEIYVIGGHFDSIARDGDKAPGADDNASGIALVLECARVLARHPFEATLQFACFNAEEYGLLGSAAYAAHLVATGDSVAGMINADMIGHLEWEDRRDLDIVDGHRAPGLREVVYAAGARYVPELPIVDGSYRPNAGSDHFSFLARGVPSLAFFEDTIGYSPYIHTGSDTYGDSYNDPLLAALITRVAVASLATLAVPAAVPVLVQDLAADRDASGVKLMWRFDVSARNALAGVTVERATAAAGPFVSLTPVPLVPAPVMHFEDAAPPASAVLWYRLVLHLHDGGRAYAGPLGAEEPERAGTSALLAVREHPAGGAVEVRYTLGWPVARLRLGVYDLRGRLVRDLVIGSGEPGAHLCTWDRRDLAGARAARGVYFVRLAAGTVSATRKLVLVHD